MIDDVLLHCDGCRGVDNAVAYGGEIAAAIDARVHLLYLVQIEGVETYRASHKAGRPCDTEEPDDEIVERMDGLDVTFEKHVARGRPRSAIPRFCSEHDVDVVVMGGIEQTGVKRFLLDSPCEAVIDATDVPVFVVDLDEDHIRNMTDYFCWNCSNGFETTADEVRQVQCPYCGSDAPNRRGHDSS